MEPIASMSCKNPKNSSNMRRILWSIWPLLASAMFLIRCGNDSPGSPLLQGHISVDSLESLQIAYSPDGDKLNMVYQPVEPAQDGSFTFDIELPDRWLDVDIYVDNDIFGVHLERGKTAVVSLTRDDQGAVTASFDGDNADVSRVYNAFDRAFDIMKYFSPDPAESKTPEAYRQLLDREYAALKPRIEALADADLRSYYERLAQGTYDWSRLRILLDQAYDENLPPKEYPEYAEILEKVDPNDPMNIRTGLIFNWLGFRQKVQPANPGEDATEYALESIDVIEREITNPEVRRTLTNYVGYSFFTLGGGNGDVNRFWKRYAALAEKYPDIIARYEPMMKSIAGTARGSEIPYDPVLTDPEGKTYRLSDLFGRFTYIDIWATWCVPCCKEIPHLERVADHFKGNDQVLVISISTDEDRDKWLQKIRKDKPAWPQYILEGEENRRFLEGWGIGGIPRFIMLTPDGRIFSADAMRPSDERIVETIEAQLH